MYRQSGDRTGFCQPDLDRIPHSGCGTIRDQGAGQLIDLLQIVVSIVFTRFMALFQHTITCQSVLLPARNTEQSEKWRTVGGMDSFCPIVSCNLSSVFICTKRAAFLLPHGKNAALFQMLILRWILQFDLAEHVKIIPIMDARGAGRGLRAGVGVTRGAGKFAIRHAGRAAIAEAAIAAATAVITRGTAAVAAVTTAAAVIAAGAAVAGKVAAVETAAVRVAAGAARCITIRPVAGVGSSEERRVGAECRSRWWPCH